MIYNGVDLETYHPRNVALFRKSLRKELRIPLDAMVVLFLGSGFRRKGLDSLIASFPDKKGGPPGGLNRGRKRWDPTISGDGKKTWVERNILFLGPTQRSKELYAASDLFVLPTYYEPCSNACLEAMATGIPVVTSRINGAAEMITDHENGFLIEGPWNPEEIADQVSRFRSLRDRRSLSAKAGESVLPLDLDSVCKRMLEMYSQLISRADSQSWNCQGRPVSGRRS